MKNMIAVDLIDYVHVSFQILGCCCMFSCSKGIFGGSSELYESRMSIACVIYECSMCNVWSHMTTACTTTIGVV